jgi:hypothetical protein
MRVRVIAPLLLLGACHEPTFEERYAEAEKSIRATAAAIGKDLAAQEKAQANIDAAASATSPPAPASLPAAR